MCLIEESGMKDLYFKNLSELIDEFSNYIKNTFPNEDACLNKDNLNLFLAEKLFKNNEYYSIFMMILIDYSKVSDYSLEYMLLQLDFNIIKAMFPSSEYTDPIDDVLKSFIDNPEYSNVVHLDSLIKDLGINFYAIDNQTLHGIKYNTFRSWMTTPTSTRHRKPKITAWNHLIYGLIAQRQSSC